MPDHHLISAIALGVALSACCGFRVFLPLLAAAFAAHQHWIALPADMQWLSGWPSIACFGTAALVEIGAYYLPFLDNILDTIATPLAIAAGTILASALLPVHQQEPLLRWVTALIAGGGSAGTLQASTVLLRLFSTKATLGTGNPVIATGENAAAAAGSVLSFLVPVVVAAIIVVAVIWILLVAIKRFRAGQQQEI